MFRGEKMTFIGSFTFGTVFAFKEMLARLHAIPQVINYRFKATLSRCSARANLTGFFHRKTIELSLCRVMPTRKKGQLAQLVRESDLFFRVKRQIKTVLTNVVAEHVKSRMSNAKNKATVSPWFITSLNMLMCNVTMFY